MISNKISFEFTDGAYSDLMSVSKVARMMVAELGMNERLGSVVWDRKSGPVFLGRDMVEKREYSEDIAKAIDEEVKKLVEESHFKVKAILEDNIDKLKALAEKLLEKETLDAKEVKQIVGIKDKEKPQTDEGLQDK